ncbi:multicopper oxidase family protein [Methylococcus capsulatus]|jgi:FtsP/CotA-like multicopper oxidase with cupredoxin domain|uniref:Multicopper oxidase CueO n=1 Tax=Methylococcus capsulatus TaxID=414 RepID=A0AA35URW5_METCP|nr:multicopper oxidase domain-containing protein [Methylococcus capsulatus]CAI8856522.1 blue copper oxidase [Methylococcus capsulatus]
MPSSIHLSRRRFLRQTGLGMFALAGVPAWVRAMTMAGGPKLSPNKASPAFAPDVEIELAARQSSVSILPGPPTRVLQYAARLVKGPEGTLTNLPGSYLGPLIRLQKGQKVRIHFRNELAEPTIAHWHGMHVPALMDGHPMYAMDPGETFVYEFEVLNRASLNIYHPHPHELTGRQVYYGLAGGILVNDDEEAALGLPVGEYEIPIVLQDRRFDADNQLVYVRHMHEKMMGFHGDRILVNGRPDFTLEVASRAYRLRIMNGSNARIYKLGWDDGTPLTVLGTDGGLLETPEVKPYVMLAPGERLDVWADFSGRAVGSQLVMRSLPFSGALPVMARRMMGEMMHSALPPGSDYPLFTVRVSRGVSESPSLPRRLAKISRYTLADTANPDKPVPLEISEGPMSMLINRRPYAHDDLQPFERIPLGSVQLLEIFHGHGGSGHGDGGEGMAHGGGPGMGMHGGMGMGMMGHRGGMGMMGGHGGGMGMMMSMAHPIHLHGQSFQIVSRTVSNATMDDYASVRDGFVDSGWKDTVLAMPGERIRLIKPFQDFKGLFMYHCHNLEHEDMGMMREFSIE